MKPVKQNWQYANGPLMINALLLLFLLLLPITMRPAAGITVPLPLELPLQHQYPHPHPHPHSHPHLHSHSLHTRSNYYEPEMEAEALAGLAGYTQHYYGANSAAATRQTLQDDNDNDDDVGDIGDLAAAPPPAPAPYANYEPKAVTANGFVPTTALHGYNNNNYINYKDNNNINNNRLHSDAYEGKIDFVINTANYELNGNEEEHQPPPPAIYYQSYGYQPQSQSQSPTRSHSQPQAPLAPHSLPLLDYPIEQFSNYHHATGGIREQERKVAPHPRQLNDENALVYAGSLQRATLDVQQQHEQQHQRQQRQQHESPVQHGDRQLSARHIVDLSGSGRESANTNSLPPITTSVHHTPSSSKAIAGLPLAKHIEVTKNVPITHYQKQHVPYRHPVTLRVPRPVITTIPKPIPIRIPVPKTVAVPQLQEVKIPVERIQPVAVERPIPFVVERRVPYRVEKQVATPIYYPYPVKVPIVRTVVHKQRPGMGHHWTPLSNHLLG